MKKGISNFVAVVLLILIVIFLITLLWIFGIDFVKTKLDGVDRSVQAYVIINDGYTVCDYGKNLVSVQVELKGRNEAVNRVKLIFTIDGDSYSKVFDAPSVNGKKVYIVNISDEFGMDLGCPSNVKAVPIFDTLGGEVEGDASMSVEIINGTIAEGAIISLSPPTPFCSDGSCNGIEDCDSCNIDCGACDVCSLAGAFWSSGSIALSDDVKLSLVSFDCSGNYNYTIKKYIPILPDETVYFTTEGNFFTWTPGEEGTYYFDVVDVEGISGVVTSLDLEVIDEPVPGICSINGAFWSDTSIGVGDYVNLSVVSSDCSEYYDYTIKKKWWFIIPDETVGEITTVSPFPWAPSESGTYYFKAVDSDGISDEVISGEMVAS